MTSVFKIEQNIPLPDRVHGPNRVYPFNALGIGDSFFVPHQKPSIGSAMDAYQKRHGVKLTRRQEGTGTRVWRTA